MVGDLVRALRKSGELDNTYIFFTSDNGFHLGEHRLGAGKWTPYEEDIRIPLIVRGPGVPEGETLHHMVLNNDLAPTFADLAGVERPSFVDGRSLKPLLAQEPTPPEDWRKRFLVEAVAERGDVSTPLLDESEVTPVLTGDPLPNDWRRSSAKRVKVSETWGRPWMKALRTKNYLYVEYKTITRKPHRNLSSALRRNSTRSGSARPQSVVPRRRDNPLPYSAVHKGSTLMHEEHFSTSQVSGVQALAD
jgi:hypothetical protein